MNVLFNDAVRCIRQGHCWNDSDWPNRSTCRVASPNVKLSVADLTWTGLDRTAESAVIVTWLPVTSLPCFGCRKYFDLKLLTKAFWTYIVKVLEQFNLEVLLPLRKFGLRARKMWRIAKIRTGGWGRGGRNFVYNFPIKLSSLQSAWHLEHQETTRWRRRVRFFCAKLKEREA